jgi:very-short-patch-repair endonuclease
MQSDFYSYRYFASEGFLPGYSFPRLPLSAYIPARRARGDQNEFLSRPRFLAISEFGPRSFIYHEGSRYLVNQVILPADREEIRTTAAKQCNRCGYLHPVTDGDGPDLCERCGVLLPTPLRSLFRLQNVSTVRRARINSDEEERVRLGYELATGIRFAERGGEPSYRTAVVEAGDSPLANLSFGSAARLWRINLGWARRKERAQLGFILDLEQGYWAKSEQELEEDHEDPLSRRTERVIPFVEDHKNSLLMEFAQHLAPEVMASLQAALKNAIQVEFELEENELAAEPLPSPDDRRVILFYEAAEGGAGVLRRLVEDPTGLSDVATRALDLCHFDPESGTDLRRAPGAVEDCEAACYDCLMTYTNQRDHALLDRQAIRDLLLQLTKARISASPAPRSRTEQLERLKRQAGSALEKRWLDELETRNLRLPSRAQPLIEACNTRPDFLYDDHLVAVYVDGPPHANPESKDRDQVAAECMQDHGFTVIRFGHEDDWDAIFARYPGVFGRVS